MRLLSAGWYYASEILRPPPVVDPIREVAVLDVGEDTVTLDRTPDTTRPGVWGLEWPAGYARVGEVIDDSSERGVTRRLLPVTGALEAGQRVAIDAYAYPEDPKAAFSFATEQVIIEGPHGALPADLVVPEAAAPGDQRTGGQRDTWVVAVHGRGGARGEAYRAMPTLRELGLPALSIGYRNDPDAPASPDGRCGLGATEWRDLEAATDHAFARGAADVVLLGYSMGGAIVASYLRRSAHADRVIGAVLDSPVLDWGPVLRAAADDRGVPRWLIPVARALITLRTGLRWRDLDQVGGAAEFDVPLLLFHGSADATVPVESSDAFAAARPDLVTYVRVEGAGHVHAWNAHPEAYQAHLRDFLTGLLDRR